MEECLAYFRDAIERPGTVERWPEWWAANADRVRKTFDYMDYIRLKFRRLDAAKAILERLGRPAVEPPAIDWLHRTHCPHCGEPLMKFVPGAEPAREDVIAFGRRAGIEQCQQGYWLHPGVYCPLGCVQVMMEFRRPTEAGQAEPAHPCEAAVASDHDPESLAPPA